MNSGFIYFWIEIYKKIHVFDIFFVTAKFFKFVFENVVNDDMNKNYLSISDQEQRFALTFLNYSKKKICQIYNGQIFEYFKSRLFGRLCQIYWKMSDVDLSR